MDKKVEQKENKQVKYRERELVFFLSSNSNRNCLTFVTVCNCHLIAIEICRSVVSKSERYAQCRYTYIVISIDFVAFPSIQADFPSHWVSVYEPTNFHLTIDKTSDRMSWNRSNAFGRNASIHKLVEQPSRKYRSKQKQKPNFDDVYSSDLLFYESSFRLHCVTVQYSIVSWWANRKDTPMDGPKRTQQHRKTTLITISQTAIEEWKGRKKINKKK